MLFQSTPSVSRGRCGTGTAIGCLGKVSIHALRFQRAMPKARTQCVAYTKFQSTPSVSRGRCITGWPRAAKARRFNPRPPFPEGDAGSSHLGAQIQDVSIHALRFQRAMPGTGAAGEPITWFQSTPSVSRGRCAIAPRMMPTASMFQSTPSVSRGRCCFPQGEP